MPGPFLDLCFTVQNSSLALCSPRIEKLELVQFTTAEITNSTQPQLSYTDSLLTGAEYNFGQLVTLAPNLAANLTNPAIEVTNSYIESTAEDVFEHSNKTVLCS